MDTELNEFEVFPWDKNFETGIEMIDEQHQVLIGILNKLANTLADADTRELNSTFDALVNYADMHFKAEEEIWRAHFPHDPWLSAHLSSHTSFLPSINDIKKQDSHLDQSENIEDVMRFLIRWLAFHIIDNDQRMAIVVNAMKSGIPIDEAKKMANEKMNDSISLSLETILNMYEGLASRTVKLMRKSRALKEAEAKIKAANDKLEA